MTWGSAKDHPRTLVPKDPKDASRRSCPFTPCRGKSTHMGQANGVTMTSGCEWHMRLWVRDPALVLRKRAGST